MCVYICMYIYTYNRKEESYAVIDYEQLSLHSLESSLNKALISELFPVLC